MDDREQYINFDEYIRQGESQKRERADAWRVAIGLQAVDGLKTLAAIHRAIFEGVFKHAGRFRDYDISKKEWVLRGDSVLYGRWQDLRMAVEYDLEQERQFSYTALSKDQMVEHLAKFVAGLWQIHPFGEGNTRTTAIFTIKYLRSQGFSVNNDLFERYSWYFRNALVRANYRNLQKGISYEPIFLVRFFRNLLLGENNTLKLLPHKYPTSTLQVQDKLNTENPNIIRLVQVIGEQKLSVKEIMEGIGLKDRKNVLNLYLNPAITDGYIRLLYPQSPRHPRQKYLLTVKGLALFNEIN